MDKTNIFEPNTAGLFEGETITIRQGQEIIIPALSFGQLEALSKQLNSVSNIKPNKALSPQEIQDMQKIIHAAISRNYPKMTIEAIKDLLDLRNFRVVIRAILGQSGFEETAPGTVNAGETMPVA